MTWTAVESWLDEGRREVRLIRQIVRVIKHHKASEPRF
jgi:hypothetical protein